MQFVMVLMKTIAHNVDIPTKSFLKRMFQSISVSSGIRVADLIKSAIKLWNWHESVVIFISIINLR